MEPARLESEALGLWLADGVYFNDNHGKERIEPQQIMIIEILVTCNRAQQTLGDHFAHGVFGQERITRIVKSTVLETERYPVPHRSDAKTISPIAAEIACRKVSDYLARTEVIKEHGLGVPKDIVAAEPPKVAPDPRVID
jgi:hypothetical protein